MSRIILNVKGKYVKNDLPIQKHLTFFSAEKY
jgi:hypothetical protein